MNYAFSTHGVHGHLAHLRLHHLPAVLFACLHGDYTASGVSTILLIRFKRKHSRCIMSGMKRETLDG